MKNRRFILYPIILVFSLIFPACLFACSFKNNPFSFTANITDNCIMKLGETKELSATLQSQLNEPCTIYHPGFNPIQIYIIEVNDTTPLSTSAINHAAVFTAHEAKTNTFSFTPAEAGTYRFIAKSEITLNHIENKFYIEYLIQVVE